MPGCRYLNHGRRNSMYCNGFCEKDEEDKSDGES